MMNKEEIKIDGIPIQDYGTPNSRTCYSSNYTSKEEQEAIEQIKIILNDETTKYYYNEEAINSINIVLNYISKLQKELEQEKENNEKQFRIDTAEEVLKWKSKYHLLSRKINGVLEDKIRDKIKELEKQCETELLTTWLEAKIEVLEELLKENKI